MTYIFFKSENIHYLMCSISGRSWTCDWITGCKVVRVWSWCILYGGWGKCYILNIPGPPFCCRETVAKGRVTLIFFQNCSNIFKNTWKYSKISQIIWLISLKITQNGQCAYVTYLIRNLGVIIQHPDQCYSTQVKADRHCRIGFNEICASRAGKRGVRLQLLKLPSNHFPLSKQTEAQVPYSARVP